MPSEEFLDWNGFAKAEWDQLPTVTRIITRNIGSEWGEATTWEYSDGTKCYLDPGNFDFIYMRSNGERIESNVRDDDTVYGIMANWLTSDIETGNPEFNRIQRDPMTDEEFNEWQANAPTDEED